MELAEVLRHRRMVRSFQQRPVPGPVLDRVLAVVRHAPSAGYTQGNEYLLLDAPDGVADFWRLTEDPDDPLPPEARALRAPAVVLPLANRRAYTERYSQPDKIAFGMSDWRSWPAPYWDIDAGMASMLVLLAAIEEGLGAWFFGISCGEAAVLDRFGVPEDFRPIGAIAFGYPAPTDPAAPMSSAVRRPRRPVEELVHRNGW